MQTAQDAEIQRTHTLLPALGFPIPASEVSSDGNLPDIFMQ